MLTFRFSGADGRMVTAETLTSGMVGKEIKLEFTADWDGLTKTAVFTAGGVTRDVVGVSDSAVIPAEVLARPLQQLQVGIYGVAPDGRVTPTVRAEGPRILPGANPSGDAGTAPDLPVWAQLQQRIKDLEEKLSEEGQFLGLNTARISALQGMFRACVFSGDQDADSAVSAFESAFGLSHSGGDVGSEDSGDPGDSGGNASVYTVTNNLINVVNSNTATTATGFYSATLSWDAPNTLHSVTVTMGGIDITDAVYGEGSILITDVTGDIVITAEAGLPAPAYLLENKTFDGSSGQIINTGVALYDVDKDWTVFISLESDDASREGRYVLQHHSTESTYLNGLAVNRKAYGQGWIVTAVTNEFTISDDLTKAACVITHAKGITKPVYYAVVGGDLVSGELPSRGVGTDKTLRIGGCYDYEDTTESYLFIGTVNRCEVHNRVLTEAEIKERLGVE